MPLKRDSVFIYIYLMPICDTDIVHTFCVLNINLFFFSRFSRFPPSLSPNEERSAAVSNVLRQVGVARKGGKFKI
jgi:hypothetical protein